jgi:hypothetical protein
MIAGTASTPNTTTPSGKRLPGPWVNSIQKNWPIRGVTPLYSKAITPSFLITSLHFTSPHLPDVLTHRAPLIELKGGTIEASHHPSIIECAAPALQCADDAYVMHMQSTTWDQPVSERRSTWRDSNEAGGQPRNAGGADEALQQRLPTLVSSTLLGTTAIFLRSFSCRELRITPFCADVQTAAARLSTPGRINFLNR